MRIIHTPRNQQPIIPIKLVHRRHPPARFIRHDEQLVRLNTDGRIVGSTGFGEVSVQDLTERAVFGLGVWMWFVRFEDENAHSAGVGGVWGEGVAVVLLRGHCVVIN